jgi:hypothetical protein
MSDKEKFTMTIEEAKEMLKNNIVHFGDLGLDKIPCKRVDLGLLHFLSDEFKYCNTDHCATVYGLLSEDPKRNNDFRVVSYFVEIGNQGYIYCEYLEDMRKICTAIEMVYGDEDYYEKP